MLVALACSASTASLVAVTERACGANRLVVGAFGLCFLVVLLLQLRATAVVWDTLPLISFVQFPQRLFVFGSFAGAVVLGSVPLGRRRARRARHRAGD